MKDEIPLSIRIFLVVSYLILLLVYSVVFTVKTAPEGNQKVETSFGELFYKSNMPITPNMEVLGTIIKTDILDCMVKLESGGNPDAYNPIDTDGFPAHGLLQYKIFTFEKYCVDIYRYENDIWNPDIQYICASDMIRNGLGYHWPTYQRCIERSETNKITLNDNMFTNQETPVEETPKEEESTEETSTEESTEEETSTEETPSEETTEEETPEVKEEPEEE